MVMLPPGLLIIVFGNVTEAPVSVRLFDELPSKVNVEAPVNESVLAVRVKFPFTTMSVTVFVPLPEKPMLWYVDERIVCEAPA